MSGHFKHCESDTPRTDELRDKWFESDSSHNDDKLGNEILNSHEAIEKELTAARVEIAQLKSQLTKDQGCVTISRNGYVQELEQQRDRLERELATALGDRDNALSDWTQADTDSIRALHERNEAIEQRARLVDALTTVVEVARRNLDKPHPTIERVYAEVITDVKGGSDGKDA
jgi:DNA repair exonuclease SbcCD ATPase subunit